jgi:predicted SnoaL-like aldol condensation-catalyzing enzyme
VPYLYIQQLQLIPMSNNKGKAVAVLSSSLQSGDPSAFRTYVNENYVQHNLDFSTGRDFIVNALPDLKKNGTRVDIRRVIEDGDHVALHSDYNFFGEKVGFDVFRFENGRIVEHWDNLQERPAKMVSGHSTTDGFTEIKDLDKTQANKQLVQNFVQDIHRDGKTDKVTQYISTDTYIQHNPNIRDGLSGLSQALETMARQGITMKYVKIQKVIGEGNFVLTMSEGQLGSKHVAFYDLFRAENGKIVEHWDVIQDIPAKENWKNQNGKF